MPASRGSDELLALYRQAEGLAGLGWRAPQVRRWQAAALECLRRTLGFHPLVVQFQGLRFRAGSVTAGTEDADALGDERHDARLRADLEEARRLLAQALGLLGVDPKAPAAAAGEAEQDPVAAAALRDGTLSEAQRRAAAEAGRRLAAALAARPLEWGAVAASLRDLLGFGPAVGRAAVRRAAEALNEGRDSERP